MEVFRFKDEAEFTAFDDKFHKDRKIAAIYALLDDIVEAEKSDFKIFERRLVAAIAGRPRASPG